MIGKVTVETGLEPLTITIQHKDGVLYRVELRRRKGAQEENSPTVMTGDSLFERKLKADFCNYFSGKKVAFNYQLNTDGLTEFQKKVLNALREIPYGCVKSYSSIAKKIGRPRAARAVGAACGKNPFPIVIPCHRVVRADGTVGGFSAGTGIKKMLLDLEGAK